MEKRRSDNRYGRNSDTESATYDEGKIVKVGSKGKFFELFSALTVPYTADYATVWGRGGKGHAPSSGIRVQLSEWGNRNGRSETKASVRAIAPIWVFAQIKTVCERASCKESYWSNAGELPVPAGNIDAVYSMLGMLVMAVRDSLRVLYKSNGDGRNEAYLKLGQTCNSILSMGPGEVKRDLSWEYSQTRVHDNREDNGPVSVQTLTIKRSDLVDGQPARSPWLVSVDNFKAKPVRKGGMSSYDSRSISGKTSVNIRLSDPDMYSACISVEHFLQCWEMAHLGSFKHGLREHLKHREDYLNKR